MRLRFGLVLLTMGLLAVSLVIAACGGGGGGGTNVTANDQYRFEPANVSVKVNQPATVSLRNTGSLVHDWVVQGMPQTVSVKANGGQTASTTFTPTQTGTFKVICAEPGHEQSGMVGQLTVTS